MFETYTEYLTMSLSILLNAISCIKYETTVIKDYTIQFRQV